MSNEVIKVYGGFCIYCGDPGVTDEHWLPKWLGGYMYVEKACCTACQSRINDTIENPLSQGPFHSTRKHIGFKSSKKSNKSSAGVEMMTFRVRSPGKEEWDVRAPIDENPGFFGLICFDEPHIYSFRKAKRKPKTHRPTQLRIVNAVLNPSKQQAFMMKYQCESVISPSFHFETFRRFLAKVALGAAAHFFGLGFKPLVADFILNGGNDGEFYVGSTPERCPAKPDAMPHWLWFEWVTIRGKAYLEVQLQLFCHLEVPIYKVIVGEKITTMDLGELAAGWDVDPVYFAEVLTKRGELADKRKKAITVA